MSKITDRRNKLLGRLFTQYRDEPGPLKFRVNEGCEAEAASTWQEHGVCLDCSTRSISSGRCIQCGWESEGLKARHKAYAEACRCVKCGGGGPEKPADYVTDHYVAKGLGVPEGSKVCDNCLFSILD